MDEELKRAIAESAVETRAVFAVHVTSIHERLDRDFGRIEGKLGAVEAHLGSLRERMARQEERADQVEGRTDATSGRVAVLEGRVGVLEDGEKRHSWWAERRAWALGGIGAALAWIWAEWATIKRWVIAALSGGGHP